MNVFPSHLKVALICVTWIFASIQSFQVFAGPSDALDGPLLLDCPDRPNCVSSQSLSPSHSVVPFSFTRDPKEVIPIVLKIVETMERASVISSTETYLHVEFRSRIFRFVDDVEFKVDPETRTLQVRSASRLGYSDWNVNRKRVENIRNLLLGKI